MIRKSKISADEDQNKAEKKEPTSSSDGRYFEGVGRRKTAIARVRIMSGRGDARINDKKISEYFKPGELQEMALSPIANLKLEEKFHITVNIHGGGLKAQAEAVRHGLSRALVNLNSDFKKRLRGLGFLTRDSRAVERKKYGLKKARRAPQWKKR